MYKVKYVIPLAVLSLIIASCAPAPDMAVIKKTIEDFNAASMEALQSGETAALMAFYTDDAVSMPPNMEVCKGKAAIEEMMKMMAESGVKVTRAEFGTTELMAGGTMACDIGWYDMTMEIPGMGEMDDKGNFVSIWKQQEDGSWKVFAEIWNSTTPMEGMEMEKMDMGEKK